MLGFSIFDDDPIGYDGGPAITPHAPPQLILPPGYPYTDPVEGDPINNPPLGVWPIDGGPVKDPTGAVCDCLWGEPYITPEGGCGCRTVMDTEPVRKPPIKGGPTGIRRNPLNGGVRVLPGSSDRRPDLIPTSTTGTTTTTGTTAAATDEPFTIFGLNPLVAAGIAAAGIFLIVSMSGETKPTKGGTVII